MHLVMIMLTFSVAFPFLLKKNWIINPEVKSLVAKNIYGRLSFMLITC